jgi:hypothetical protein
MNPCGKSKSNGWGATTFAVLSFVKKKYCSGDRLKRKKRRKSKRKRDKTRKTTKIMV